MGFGSCFPDRWAIILVFGTYFAAWPGNQIMGFGQHLEVIGQLKAGWRDGRRCKSQRQQYNNLRRRGDWGIAAAGGKTMAIAGGNIWQPRYWSSKSPTRHQMSESDGMRLMRR